MTKAEAVAEIKEKTPALLADYRALVHAIQNIRGTGNGAEEDDAEKPEMDAEELQELYEAVLEFSAGYDIDSIDMLLKQAEDYRIPEQEAARFAEMKRCIRASDWSRLQSVLQNNKSDENG